MVKKQIRKMLNYPVHGYTRDMVHDLKVRSRQLKTLIKFIKIKI
jgi:hypothetical protein